MSLEDGIALMKASFKEINTRFLVGGCTFTLKVSNLILAGARSAEELFPSL
jgi:hypothetical protein